MGDIIHSELKQLDRVSFEALPTEVEKQQIFKEHYLDLAAQLGKGARPVQRTLKKLYPIDHPCHLFIPHLNTLQKHIKKDKEDKHFNIEKSKKDKPQLYAYLRQLQKLNTAIFSKENQDSKKILLTNLFVKHAEICLYSFNDPLGEKVDLLAQWCVIREYYSRARVDNTFTDDLDAILEHTPWLDVEYDPTQTIYALAVNKNPKDLVPRIGYAMVDGKLVDGRFIGKIKDNAWQICVYYQLRLPYHVVFINRYEIKTTYRALSHVNTIMFAPIPTPEQREQFGIKSPEEYRRIPIAKGMIADSLINQ